MQHKHTQVSSRSGHVPASAPFKVVIGVGGANPEFVSCFCSRPEEGTSSLAGERLQPPVLQLYQGVMMCNKLLSCDDISRSQDGENDDWQGSFSRSRCIEF